MEDLQKENERLKAENQRLERLSQDLLAENKYLKEKVREENRMRIRYMSFKERPKPTLCLDHAEVAFKSSSSNTTKLLAQLFKTKTIDRMREEAIPIDELHDLLHGDDTEGEWFSLSKVGIEKAKNDMRGLFRNINNEVKVKLNGENLFVPDNNGFKLNEKVLF